MIMRPPLKEFDDVREINTTFARVWGFFHFGLREPGVFYERQLSFFLLGLRASPEDTTFVRVWGLVQE